MSCGWGGDVMERRARLTSMLRHAAIFFHVYFRRRSSRNDADLREQNPQYMVAQHTQPRYRLY